MEESRSTAAAVADASAAWPAQLRRLQWTLLFAVLSAAAFAAAVGLWRVAAGDSLKQAAAATSFIEFRHLRLPTGLDSWGPMFSAWNRLQAAPHGAMYADSLALDNCKFQYPPSSLLILELLPAPPAGQFVCSRDADLLRAVEDGAWTAKPWVDRAALLAVLATIVASAWVALRALRGADVPAWPRLRAAQAAGLCALFAAAGLVFHPVIWGYELGQVQVFLNLLMTLALLAALSGRQALAGALIGLCCLFKPQYALVLLWAVWRRQWRLAAGLAGVGVLGTLAAMDLYGWALHHEYLDFLRELARRGEVYWANQTAAGLLNRLLLTADPLQWADSMFASATPVDPGAWAFAWDAVGFPPYHPLVYWATLLSSAAIVAAALLSMRRTARTPMALTLELGIAVAVSTVASPIAWHHHYGSFLPLMALACGLLLRPLRMPRASLVLLAASWVLLANSLLRPELLFGNRVLGLLASNTFYGALLLLGVLIVLRRRSDRSPQGVADAGRGAPLPWAAAPSAMPG